MVILLGKYELKHLDYLLVVDEVGLNLYFDYENNTSSKKWILGVASNCTNIRPVIIVIILPHLALQVVMGSLLHMLMQLKLRNYHIIRFREHI